MKPFLFSLFLFFIAVSSVSAGTEKLVCFSVTPETSFEKTQSCASLCAAKSAVCTGVTSPLNPPQTCESLAVLSSCRCCAIKEEK